VEEAVTSEPVSGKRPENSLPGGKNKTLGSRSNSPENGTPSGGGGPHYGILFPPITRTRARQPAPVQPLASRRVTYRSNRSNAPQNLLIFSHSGVASASASSGEQSLDAVDMSDAPSDQALAFPMGRRASLSLDSGYLERRPIRGARLERDQARRSAKALIWWSLHDARSTANVFQICTEEKGPEGATLSDVNRAGRRSSGSSREASAVEPTRSQNMTVR
jgi:hypothetical protein